MSFVYILKKLREERLRREESENILGKVIKNKKNDNDDDSSDSDSDNETDEDSTDSSDEEVCN